MQKRVFKNLKANWAFLPLAAVTIALCAFGSLEAVAKGLWAVPAVSAVAAALFLPHLFTVRGVPKKQRRYCGLLAAAVAVLAALDLYKTMPNGAYFEKVFETHPTLQTPLMWVSAILLGITMFWTVFLLLLHFPRSCACRYPQNSVSPTVKSKKNTVLLWLYCALTAFIVLTVCTKSSFLYPFNDWVDANCFFTVGKALANGKVLYRDIYEQKGPWLYFLHAICYRISEKTFFGVYLLELLSGTVFLYFAAKLMQLYRARGIHVLLPLLAAVIYASYAFCHGDSVEELCLPLFSAGLYITERAFCEKRTVTLRGWILLGVLGGLVFWMKFNLVGFFVGLALVPLWRTLRRDGVGALFKAVLCILMGVLLPSIPVLVYFGSVGAFHNLWEAYFYNNLFLYADSGDEALTAAAFLERLFLRIRRNVSKNVLFAVPGFAAVLWYTATAEKGRRAHLLLCALFTVLFVYSGDVAYPYYSLILAVFSVFAAVALGKCADRVLAKPTKRWLTVSVAVMSLCCAGLLAFYTSNNVYLMQYSKDDLPQYRFAKIINSVENPTLLNYGFLDGGFYTTTGIVPDSRYFCRLNISLSEMYVEQSMAVYRQKTDFVVTRNKPLQNDNYICVDMATMY
ncbi:MAG: glycosyltransferase family 39 protein, partial [Candidatus Fimenecus sp.]